MAAAAGEADVLTAHASIVDALGTLCVGDSSTVGFTIEGAAQIVGPASVSAEAGVASIVVRVPAGGGGWRLAAQASDLLPTAWPESGGQS